MSDIVKVKKKKGRKPGKYYISNDELIHEIRLYYKSKSQIPRQLGLYVLKIVDGVAHSPNFINYSYRDEMESDALYRITKAIADRGCIIYPDEILGEIIYKEVEDSTYMLDNDGNLCKDSNGKKIPASGIIQYKVDRSKEYLLDKEGNRIPKVYENNPFGYFTMIAWRAFQGRIKLEKKFHETNEAFKDKVYTEFESEYGISHSDTSSESDTHSYEDTEL